jgi:hypothetical protein
MRTIARRVSVPVAVRCINPYLALAPAAQRPQIGLRDEFEMAGAGAGARSEGDGGLRGGVSGFSN